MKPTQLLSNRRRQRGSPRVSLFPFLAVLICTMGALVLLLLVVTRQARLQALHEARAKTLAAKQAGDEAATPESITTAQEVVRWNIEQMRQSRRQTEEQLTEARLTLGHIEDHSRRLRERLKELADRAKDLDLEALETQKQYGARAEELQHAEADLSQAQRQLDEARQQIGKRPRSYAVVPYEGPNQTRRRPIYLECLADSVVLRPENITFTEADFDGPQGPGNPLAAALRAARQQLLDQGSIDGQQASEPYPLLLVRPSGIPAYYAARAAMKSWASEFGYELIGEDWPLTFPPPDRGLAQVVQQAADAARAEQQRLIAAAPSRYGKRAVSGAYRVSARGGPSRDGGSPAEEGGSGFYAERPSGRYGSRAGVPGQGGAAGQGTGAGQGGSSSGGMTGVAVSGSMSGGGVPGGGMSGGGMSGGGMSGGGMSGGGMSGGGMSGGGMSGGTAGGSVAANNSLASSQERPSTQPRAAAAPRPDGYVAGRAFSDPPPAQPRRPDEVVQRGGTPLRPGEWHPSEEYAQPEKRKEDEKRSRKEREEEEKRREQLSKIDRRSADWGLRDASRNAAAIARPIRIDCYPDRLVLVPEPGRGYPRVVSLGSNTRASADAVISAVWEQMDSWGIAGRGMYWRPILQVYVAPGAESRMDELADLLDGSGMTLQRR